MMRVVPVDPEPLVHAAIAGCSHDPINHPSNVDQVSIVVPCHNESESLGKLRERLDCLQTALAGHARLELLLVDDGSTDDTANRMRELFAGWPGATVLRHESKRGVTAAIATGLRAATSPVAASLDADCTYDPLQLVPMLRLLADDVDLVVASPYHPEGSVRGAPRWRIGLSRLASRLYRLLLANKLHTYTSCLRVYRRDAVTDLPLDNSGFVGVVELLWRVDRTGRRIVEHPANLTARTTGCSKMRTARTTLAHLRLLARIAGERFLSCKPNRIASTAELQPLDARN